MTEDGAFTSGANVENASYPVGTCAERCAGVKAIVSFCLFCLFFNGFLYRSAGLRGRALDLSSAIIRAVSKMIVSRRNKECVFLRPSLDMQPSI